MHHQPKTPPDPQREARGGGMVQNFESFTLIGVYEKKKPFVPA